MKIIWQQSWLILIIIGCSFGQKVNAQFSLSAELRPRTEYSHGQAMPAAEDQSSSLFTSQRTRLNFGFANEDNVKLGIVLQDVRTWGNQPQLVSNEDFATSIHQAWGEFAITDGFFIKAGRQELVYDDSRILGNVGWAQQARSHDVALFKYTRDFNLHVGIGHNENNERTNNYYGGPDAYKNLQFIWFNNNAENLTYSILLLNNGIAGPVPANGSDQDVFYSQTIGGRIQGNIDNINIAGNLYYQTGKDAVDRDLSAFEIALEANTELDGIEVSGRYELLSGTEPGETDNNSFTPLYGTNHKFNGFMDYFYVGNHINSVGLHNLQLTGFIPFGKSMLRGDIHYFASHKEFDDGNFLGIELDLGITIPVNNAVTFSAGYSQMLPSSRLALLKGVNNKGSLHNWAYLMLSFSPDFL